jgi:hypothetical protein
MFLLIPNPSIVPFAHVNDRLNMSCIWDSAVVYEFALFELIMITQYGEYTS